MGNDCIVSQWIAIKMQQLYDDSSLTYFLHIPKTSGTSFSQVLDSLVPNSETICPAKLWRQLLPLIPYDWSKTKLLRGHFGYGIHRNIPKRLKYLTFLRDPIERCISSYHHLCIDYDNARWVDNKSKINPKLGLDFILNERHLYSIFFNVQTWHLGNDIDMLEKVDFADLEKSISAIESSAEQSLPHKQTGEQAMQHIQQVAWFGIQEFYEQSMLLFSYTFNVPVTLSQQKLMVLPGRPATESFSKDTIDELKRRNIYDQSLYELGVTVFTSRYIEMLKNLEISVPQGFAPLETDLVTIQEKINAKKLNRE